MYWFKLMLCILYEGFDMTVGRFLFMTPFAGEVVGVALACALFGPRGLFYALEILDPTEQLDGFIPTATLIALAHRRAELEEQEIRDRQMIEGKRV